MPQIQQNTPIYNNQAGIPLYSNANNTVATQQPVVNTTIPYTNQIYSYPQASLYPSTTVPATTSGVNINIYNPSGVGGSNSMANASYYTPVPNTPQNINANKNASANANVPAQPIANTPIQNEESKKNQKTKRVVNLTDDYIKSLESYLRSQDENVRKTGIKELIQRFEEDESRYDDPALTALLNIALQDPKANNRLLAMSPIAGGSAHGDTNTIQLLKQLQTSDKIYGQEAVMASNSLIKAAQTTTLIPDNSPDKKTTKE